MEDNGLEVLVMTFNHHTGDSNTFGTNRAVAFAKQRIDVTNSFLASMSGELDHVIIVSQFYSPLSSSLSHWLAVENLPCQHSECFMAIKWRDRQVPNEVKQDYGNIK